MDIYASSYTLFLSALIRARPSLQRVACDNSNTVDVLSFVVVGRGWLQPDTMLHDDTGMPPDVNVGAVDTGRAATIEGAVQAWKTTAGCTLPVTRDSIAV